MLLDDTLLYPRHITRWIEEEENVGWYVLDLDCGHTVRSALEPSIAVPCGYCLERLVSQIREIQAAQRMR